MKLKPRSRRRRLEGKVFFPFGQNASRQVGPVLSKFFFSRCVHFLSPGEGRGKRDRQHHHHHSLVENGRAATGEAGRADDSNETLLRYAPTSTHSLTPLPTPHALFSRWFEEGNKKQPKRNCITEGNVLTGTHPPKGTETHISSFPKHDPNKTIRECAAVCRVS